MKNLVHFIIGSPWPSGFIRISLGIIFLYAGAVKLVNVKEFARLISRYDLVPDLILPVVAIGLPVLELLAGLGLILFLRGSLSLTLSLLILFVTMLWYGILKDLDIDCGCFSVEELRGQADLWQAFYRDLLMILGVFFLYGSRWFQMNREVSLPLWIKIKRII